MQAYLTLLQRRPDFRSLWVAQLVSMAGDWFNTVATVVLVNRYGHTGLAVSGLFLARYLPPFFFGPLAGVVADRFDRKTILITSDVLRVFIVLGFLTVNSADRVWLVYVLTTAQFIVSAFFEPARSALVPQLVLTEELVITNTLAGVTYSSMLVLGAVIGGVVAGVFGTGTALVIDSLSFAVSASIIWQVAAPKTEPQAGVPTSGWSDMLAGFQFTRQRPDVGLTVLVKGMGQLGSLDVIAATLATRLLVFGSNSGGTYGLLMAAFGIGTVFGPVAGNLFHKGTVSTLRRAIGGGFALIVIGWLLIGTSPWLALTLVAFTLRGLGGGVNWVYSDVLLQMTVPNKILGRIFSLDLAFFMLVISASTLATGALLDYTGDNPQTLALWMGVASILPLAVWLTALRRNRLAQPHEAAMQKSE